MPILGFAKAFYTVKKAEKADAEKIKVLRKKRLKPLLYHVLNKSEFYKRYYKEHGITIDRVDKVTLKDLPPIDKGLMMKNFDEFVCDPALKEEKLIRFINDTSTQGKKYKGRYQVIHSSGSTGTLGLFVYGKEDWIRLGALLTRGPRFKVTPLQKIRLAYIGVTEGHHTGITLSQDMARFFFIELLPLSINSPLQEMCYKINEFKPNSLSGYTSGIYLLAQEQIRGNIDIKLNSVRCSAELLTPGMERTIRKAFGVSPANYYGATESAAIAAQCHLCRNLHLFDDWHCLEIVDERLEDVNPGQSGTLLLTNLYNFTQPLIRYRMKDVITIDNEPCKCGWPFPVVKDIDGRQEEFLWFEKANGEKEYIHPRTIGGFLLPGLEKLQVVQTQKNGFTMKVKIHGNKKKILPIIHRKMKEVLQQKRIDDIVNFNVVEVEEINNDPLSGKYKLVIPLKVDEPSPEAGNWSKTKKPDMDQISI